jgi:hypothetical protein
LFIESYLSAMIKAKPRSADPSAAVSLVYEETGRTALAPKWRREAEAGRRLAVGCVQATNAHKCVTQYLEEVRNFLLGTMLV